MSRRDLCIMACVFCKDPLFRQWCTPDGEERITEAVAKEVILTMCQIDSRNQLDTDAGAAERFHKHIREPFLAWKDQQRKDV